MQTIRLTGARCKCSACGEYFNSASVFDKHRVGSYERGRRCLSASEMLARSWIRNAAGFWIRGHRPNFTLSRTRDAQETRSALTLTHGAVHG